MNDKRDESENILTPIKYLRAPEITTKDFLKRIWGDSEQMAILWTLGLDGKPLNHVPKKINEIYENMQWLDLDKDTYFSVNSYMRPSEGYKKVYPSKGGGLIYQDCRKEDLLSKLNAFYVDVDCRGTYEETMSILAEIEKIIFGVTVPYPDSVVYSGQGLHMYWLCKHSGARRAKYKAVNKYLNSQFIKYGVDTVHDASRLMRVPGAINTKSGNRCKVILLAEDTRKYTIEQMMDTFSIIESNKEYEDKLDKDRAYKGAKGTNTVHKPWEVIPCIYGSKVYRSTEEDYCNDLIKELSRLVAIRKGKMEGYRMEIMKYYAAAYRGIGISKGVARQRLYTLRAKFAKGSHPVYDKDVEYALETGYDREFRFTSYTIIKGLAVTHYEQRLLKILATANIRKEVHREKINEDKKAKRRDEKGLTAKSNQYYDACCKVYDLMQTGMGIRAIAKEIGKSATYVGKITKFIEDCLTSMSDTDINEKHGRKDDMARIFRENVLNVKTIEAVKKQKEASEKIFSSRTRTFYDDIVEEMLALKETVQTSDSS